MHVARLEAHDGGPAVPGVERSGESGWLHPPLLVGRDRLGRAESQEAERQVDGVVPLGAHEHAYARRLGESLGGDVPAVTAQHLVAASGQAGEVGHRPARHEADGAARRQAQQVQQPGLGQVLHGRVGGSDRAQAAVLVPGADQPVDGQGCGVRAADHEAEEPTAGHGGQPRVAGSGELVDDLRRVGRSVWEHSVEAPGDVLGPHRRRHRSVREGPEPLEGEGVSTVEAGRAVAVHPDVHPASVCLRSTAVERFVQVVWP